MWYYAQGNEQIGPVEEAAFEAAVSNGTVTDATYVWREGMPEWQPWEVVRGGGRGGMGAPIGAACSVCGLPHPPEEMVAYQGQYICAACKPLHFQRLREGQTATGFEYAGFWIRFGAKLIDYVITNAASISVGMLLGLLSPVDVSEAVGIALALAGFFMGLFIGFAYPTFFVGRFGATPGKMIFGLKVVRPDGEQVTYLRAFGRTAAEILSAMVFGVGYIMAAFDTEKRTLHDYLADTRVIRN
jgi:uncharacterized RDD family membrane protein YckC